MYVSRIHLRSLRPDAPRGQEDTKLTLLHDGVVPQGAAWLARVQIRLCMGHALPAMLAVAPLHQLLGIQYAFVRPLFRAK